MRSDDEIWLSARRHPKARLRHGACGRAIDVARRCPVGLGMAACLLAGSAGCVDSGGAPSWADAAPAVTLDMTDSGAETSADAGADGLEAVLDVREAGDASNEADTDAVSFEGQPAAHASLPRVETFGGPVLGAPNVVPIFFGGDPLQPQIEQFLSQLEGSSYWSATTGEYGVGALRVGRSIVVPDDPPASATTASIANWLAGHLGARDAQWPTIDGNNVYAVFYPEATTVTGLGGTTSCADFGAFHYEGVVGGGAGNAPNSGVTAQDASVGSTKDGATGATTGDGAAGNASAPDAVAIDSPATLDDAGADAPRTTAAVDGSPDDGTMPDAASVESGAVARGVRFAFVAVPRCATFNDLTGIDVLTSAISHELVETATDPFPATNPAYGVVDFDHLAWDMFLGGSEIADMCHSESPDREDQRLVGGFVVERSWSNRAAELGQDPCVPAISDVYIGAAPDFDETVVVPNPPSKDFPNLLTTGESIAVGRSRTVGVRLFSSAPTGDWSVRAVEKSATDAGASLQFTWDRMVGNDGDVLTLRIARTAQGPDGGTPIAIESYRRAVGGGSGTIWAGLVTE